MASAADIAAYGVICLPACLPQRMEPIFLSKLLHCLGTVLQCARHALDVPKMTARLSEFAWQLRMHSDAAVSILRSLACGAGRG